MTSPYIRPLTPYDYDQWWELYQGCAVSYHVALTKEGAQTTWSSLLMMGMSAPGLWPNSRASWSGLRIFAACRALCAGR